jgi:hypothetical protein
MPNGIVLMTRSRRGTWRAATVLPAVLTTLAGVAAVVVVSAASPAVRAASWADRSPFGVLNTLGHPPGGLRAVGWAIEPDAKTTPVRINARVDGTLVAGMRADLPRQDVRKAYPRSGANHGFDLFIPVPEGRHQVCIRAVNIGKGRNFLFRCVTRTFDYGPFGALNALRTTPGHLYVKGWAVDPDRKRAAVTATVLIDGTANPLIADKPRTDVARVHPFAGADHGFEATLPLAQGTHKVCVTTKNIGYGSNNSFGCRTVTLNDSPVGGLGYVGQQAGKLKVVGWAVDDDVPATPVDVTIKIDTTSYTVPANVARNDVATKYPAAGKYHGFVASYQLPEGTHSVCVTAHNTGYGSDVAFPCRKVTLSFTPRAAITSVTPTSTGATIRGWALDPDTTDPITVAIAADGGTPVNVTANRSGATNSGHNFVATLRLQSGDHNLCATALNVLYGTRNSKPACSAISLKLNPIGAFESLTRATGTTNATDLAVTGWALDPDTNKAIDVKITLDGAAYGAGPILADTARTDIRTKYRLGLYHGISTTVSADDGEHTVCLWAVNVGLGADVKLGCKLIIAVHPVVPSAPQNVNAVAGYGGAEVSWSPPASDGGAPWTQYTVVAWPGGRRVTVGASATSATVLGLQPSTTYFFNVRAINVVGASDKALSPKVRTEASPPPQTTPAPVSTSRYIRNIRGASATEQATMRAEGAKDAYYNPSGHGYLILLDIGGQDQYDGGVVLSATTRFVSYANLVADLKAYVDGYHSKQRASAPVTIAIGTNNDMDVSYAAGKAWATKVVNPIVTYTRNHYTGITIAGANDIEPGFRATYTQTRSWLNGYLASTRAPFVFNGSADGCSWTTTNRACNNGWSMGGLYYLAAGAAPARMLNLPQIYNTTMAAQWKYISLTGVASGSPRINFGGTLTEWTACNQANSCGSLTGNSAWSTMWSNLQSDSRLKVASLPYSTDLRIDW